MKVQWVLISPVLNLEACIQSYSQIFAGESDNIFLSWLQ